ncbi:ninja-family protein AFP3-like isoform X2 [Impatiens glandulifera]|uniref:ninja-family protein AFP3-like isoform X2 n=1 Tax=Impatiens glandulifera TaxID=253017 RepID=UPI001FB0DE1C|nr:ninja-family protein AFP3-like isoform X2 [Impatiens glandulifera]
MKEGIILKNENSVQVNEFSIDLLPAFMSRKSSVLKLNEEEEGDDDIELSLSLSLNGQFGFDPKRVNKLSRSSSIPEIMTTTTTTEETNKSFAVKSLTPAVHAPLSRTCSLPIESEEWRKRKELQSLRRLEAKRKRLEKLKNPKSGRDLEGGVAVNGYGEFSLPFGLPKSSSVMKGEKAPLFRQGSIGSQGSGSSGISESECLPLPPRAKRKVEEFGQVKKEEEDKNGGGLREGSSEAKEMLKKALLDMPYVSTTGEGTDGRKIGGFLYRYSKGEEAKIVCVCHGSFLSPAEFVKHAGGGDVSHPLKHILVSPSPLV